MNERKVILIDGPERGRVIESDAQSFVVPRARPLSIPDLTGYPSDATFDTIIYNICRVALFGRIIYVGTVRYAPHPVDLFEALASNTAKDLVNL